MDIDKGTDRPHRSKVEVLRAVAERLNREVHLQPMLDAALALILELLDLRAGWIFLLDEQGQFTLAAAHGLPPKLARNGRAALRWTTCRCQEMLRNGELTGGVNILDCERLRRVQRATAGTTQPGATAGTTQPGATAGTARPGAGAGGEDAAGGLHVHVSVPLRAGGRTLGLMNLARAGKEPLDGETLAVLGLLADTLGVAIERARLYARMEAARRDEAETITRLTQTLLGLTGLEDIAAAVFAVLREFLEPDGLSLLVADPSGSFLELAAAWGWSEAYVGRLKLALHPPESSGPAWALHAREPVVHHHGPAPGPYTVPEPVRRAGVRVSLHLPMVSGDRATGVLVVDYLAPRALGEDQIRLAGVVAGVAAVAVERALEHQRNRTLFQQVPVGLFRSTPDGRLLDVNNAMVRMLGYPDRESLLAVHAVDLYANPDDRARWQELVDREGVVTGFEVQWRRLDGTVIWVRESSRVVRDAAGRPAYYEGSAEDITARKRVEADLQYLASHDPLTGAYNRHRFQDELHRLVARARRAGESGALLFIDLDNFKEVNDRLGHKAGDDLLRAVVRAMRGRLRETDVLARLGGDEFGVAVAPVDGQQALAIAERLLNAVREQVVLVAGRPVRLTASCGVALFPEHGLTVDEVLAAADLSMYVAKSQGGDRAMLYVADPAWRQRFHSPLEWGERLQRALAEDRLVAYAQPVLDLRRDRITQWEFLVRLEEQGEIIPPAAFLPVAERLNLIQAVDAWICRQALRFAARHDVVVHINLSPRTLADEQAIRTIAAELDAHEGAAARLVVEITETAAVADVAQTLRYLEVLRSRGCKLALDDFGVGFSSLYYLRHMPVDYLKIDASFIRGLAGDPQDRHIVRAIAEMARGLGKATIAEGVEDEATLEAVRALGVDYAQGYHVGRPVPASRLLEGPLPRRP